MRSLKGVEEQLWAACIEGDLPSLRSSLARGADPNARHDDGVTPLHAVCRAPQTSPATRAELVRALLTAGASPYARDDDGHEIECAELKSTLLLRNARHDETPRPLVIFRGDEHPLLPYMLHFEPEAEGVARKTHWTEVEHQRAPLGQRPDQRQTANPCSLFAEASPEVPRGMVVSFQLSESLASNDVLRRELLGREERFGSNYALRYGYHTDATFEQCWRALPRLRPVYRWSDLRRRFAREEPLAVESTLTMVRSRGPQRDYDPFAAHWVIVDAAAVARGDRLPPCVSEDEQAGWCAFFASRDYLQLNELDLRVARSLLDGGGLLTLDTAINASDVSVDRHARFRAWAQAHGASEHELLRAALFSWQFTQRWTGREAWVATRSIEAITAALIDRPPHAAALQRVLILLTKWLKQFTTAPQKAADLWEHVRPRVSDDAVVAMLERDRALFESWVAPHANALGDAVRARLAAPQV